MSSLIIVILTGSADAPSFEAKLVTVFIMHEENTFSEEFTADFDETD